MLLKEVKVCVTVHDGESELFSKVYPTDHLGCNEMDVALQYEFG